MKNSKKVIALILASLMIQGAMTLGAVSVSAATTLSTSAYSDSVKIYNGFTYEDINSTSVKITGYQKSGKITIPSTIYGKTVTEINCEAFKGKTGLQSVVIPGTVKTIDKDAFRGCTGLRSVTISSGVQTILEGAFNGCTALPSITFPDSVKKIGGSWSDGGAFQGCTALKTVTFGKNLSEIDEWAFSGCTSLSSIAFPVSLKTIGCSAFDNCDNIKSVTITKNISVIEQNAFSSCDNLQTVIMQGNALKIIPQTVFANCKNLKNVTIGSGVTTISGEAFENCTSLQSIKIPDSVKTIGGSWSGGAFQGCTALKTVTFGKNLSEIDEWAFSGCISLASVAFPDSLKTIGDDAFADCDSLTSVTITKNISKIGSSAFSSCDNLQTVIMQGNALKTISQTTFANCKNLKNVTIGSGVTTISDYAFENCISLKSIKIPDSVKIIDGSWEGAFQGCTALKKIQIPSSVTTISGHTFDDTDKNLTIYGANGSYAQKFAKTQGIKFIVGNMPADPIIISAAGINLNASNVTLSKGGTYNLYASIYPSNTTYKSVSWSSNNNNVVSVYNGKITARGIGTAYITAKTSNGKTALCKVTVTNYANKITLNRTDITLGSGETYNLYASISPYNASNKNVYWSSNNNNVVSVYNGKITARGIGTAYITAKTSNGKTAVCKVTAKNAPTGIKLEQTSITLGVGETFRLQSHTQNGASYKRGFGSSNGYIVHTSGDGLLTAKKVGTAYITVKTYNGKTASCKVTVKPAASGIILNKTSVTLKVGQKFQLQSYAQKGASYKRGFGSSNGNIVHTSGTGLLTAKKVGTAYITVKTFNGKTAKCKVTVVR